jgi:two-component system response regulator PilR (NtrC family)
MSTFEHSGLEPLKGTIPRVLIVDDEPDLRELLELTVLKMGFDVESVGTLGAALSASDKKIFSLCLTDMRLPDGDGITLVSHFSENHPLTPVVVITAFGSTETAVSALKAGAFDYVTKPVGLDQLRKLIQSALLSQERTRTRKLPASTAGQDRGLIGTSPPIAAVREMIIKLARSMAPVAIHGESGTGKELAARAIHGASARVANPFVAVNCGAIPENLMEAEFFGYRKGAFTGAESDRDGFFQAAHGGTLMLDEVAELPLAMQVKLLRVIQERKVRKVGSTNEEPVDVRIISATHRSLPDRVASGLFRQDLYYRLNVIELKMPPLRDRVQDIPQIAEAILAKLARSEGRERARTLSVEAVERLSAHPFAGNVRELENVLERASTFATSELIDERDLGLSDSAEVESTRFEADATPSIAEVSQAVDQATTWSVERQEQPFAIPQGMSNADLPLTRVLPPGAETYIGSIKFPLEIGADLEAIERAVIEKALQHSKFNRTAASKALGLTFRQLRYRMQQLGIR